jgi:hypothetical protein
MGSKCAGVAGVNVGVELLTLPTVAMISHLLGLVQEGFMKIAFSLHPDISAAIPSVEDGKESQGF